MQANPRRPCANVKNAKIMLFLLSARRTHIGADEIACHLCGHSANQLAIVFE